ncbi:MAG: DUF89 family protein [Dethiobacter sp.]|nr:MAG: DUF89 family protein [Dethiobacter sp.]
MKPNLECGPCLLKWVYDRAGIMVGEEKRFELIRNILSVLSREFCSTGNVGWLSNRIMNSIHEFVIDSARYFEGVKLQSNKVAEELLPLARNFIEEGQTDRERFERACGLSAGTNVAPIGLPSEGFKFEEALNMMMQRNPLPAVIGNLFKAVRGATHILYIADNAGEIGFDSLFIARLKEMGLNITLVVKEDPFFEDATTRDVSFFKLDQLVDNILTTNGYFIPNETTPSLSDSFKKSDLVIAKGTGSYEALKDERNGKTIIYLLKVKCKPIAMRIGVNTGNFVVKLEMA